MAAPPADGGSTDQRESIINIVVAVSMGLLVVVACGIAYCLFCHSKRRVVPTCNMDKSENSVEPTKASRSGCLAASTKAVAMTGCQRCHTAFVLATAGAEALLVNLPYVRIFFEVASQVHQAYEDQKAVQDEMVKLGERVKLLLKLCPDPEESIARPDEDPFLAQLRWVLQDAGDTLYGILGCVVMPALRPKEILDDIAGMHNDISRANQDLILSNVLGIGNAIRHNGLMDHMLKSKIGIAMGTDNDRSYTPMIQESAITFDMDSEGERVVLGTGGFGTTYCGWYDYSDGQRVRVAMKILTVPTELKTLRSEAAILRKIDHPNVLKCFGLCCFGSRWGLVMNLASLGPLSKYTESRKLLTALIDQLGYYKWMPGAEEAETKFTLFVLYAVASALRELHHHRIIHRDMKPENILLADEEYGSLNVLVCDFGLAEQKEKTRVTRGFSGTMLYSAPEVFAGKVGVEGDIFGFGMIAFELITLRKPYYEHADLNLPKLAMMVNQGVRRRFDGVTFAPAIPADIKELVESCWHTDADKRPIAAEICKVLKRHLQVHLIANKDPNAQHRQSQIAIDRTCESSDRMDAVLCIDMCA